MAHRVVVLALDGVYPFDLGIPRAGFGTDTSLRQHPHAAIGVHPLTYRRTFRGTADSIR
ncbi:hypothetical protein ACIODX_36555 [Streptomyces sp. NPDC088190]|uniref:hypothetical protein n=1 Tax=unclassified Streptomyces TaxID=2593676 RepID=UPI0033ED1032